jgi:hypothetical protein
MRTEYLANDSLSTAALERARWAAVLAPSARRAIRKPVKRGFFARLLSRI